MQVEPSIFKTYDIRGIYPDELNEDVAYVLAKAFAHLLINEASANGGSGKKLRVALGHDARVSSPSITAKVLEGLLENGLDVDQVGLGSTPTFYFTVANGAYDGGIQVSASHNPKIWNGLKLTRARAVPITKNSGILEMKRMVEADDFIKGAESGETKVVEGILKIEANTQLAGLDLASIKKMKILADACNGMGAADLNELFERLPQCQIVRENFELDGNFPGHGEADPIKPKIYTAVGTRVRSEMSDLGIITDGDGDRIVFIDEKGEWIAPYIMRAILAEIELKEHTGAAIVYDLRPGRILEDVISEQGGKAIVSAVGNPILKEKMLETKAIFGGETSGHMIHAFEYGVMEAPIYSIAKFLIWLSQRDVKVSEAVLPFRKYYHSGDINVPVASVDQAKNKIQALKKHFADGKVSELDGLSVEYPDFWFNIRPSNTEPLLRLTVEATTQEVMDQKRNEIEGLIEAPGESSGV